MVGDIPFDPKVDDPAFILCDSTGVKQYHNLHDELEYNGEKSALVKSIKEQFKFRKLAGESGMIRIRFIVNCKGKTDRFRLTSATYDYKEKKFDPDITGQLLSITKNLKGWKILSDKNGPKDYYQYLIFKLSEGNLDEILP